MCTISSVWRKTETWLTPDQSGILVQVDVPNALLQIPLNAAPRMTVASPILRAEADMSKASISLPAKKPYIQVEDIEMKAKQDCRVFRSVRYGGSMAYLSSESPDPDPEPESESKTSHVSSGFGLRGARAGISQA